ncbi:MAG: hypothetical protein GWN58_37500 [Anaerolineae bacterium]|nr:hypothetical protein [Anaerolineae bacterium]
MLFILAVGASGLWRITGPGRVPKLIVAGNGILDAGANVTLLLALRSGSLALAAVSASFYPAVTVVIARAVNQEHLRGRQIFGILLAVAALVAIAIG